MRVWAPAKSCTDNNLKFQILALELILKNNYIFLDQI